MSRDADRKKKLLSRSVPRMSIFRNKVLTVFALMSLATLTIMYTNTRIIITNEKLKSHNHSVDTNGHGLLSNVEDTKQAVASNMLTKLRVLLSTGAGNAIVKDSRLLPEETTSTIGLTAYKNQNSVDLTLDVLNTRHSNTKSTYLGTWLNKNEQREYIPSVNRARKDKIRIVTYHIYHTLLKWAAKKLDMTKCHHSSNCEVIYQGKCSSDPVQADAVVFQGNNLPRDRPVRLHTDQAFVYLNIESPQYLQQVKLANPFFKDFFNWSMTYRRDSDIPYLYGSVLPRSFNKSAYLYNAEKTSESLNFANFQENKLNEQLGVSTNVDTRKDYTAIFRKKTKSSVWFVSHCGTASRRERYVSRMTEFTDIDIFGRCSNRTNECPKKNPDCGDNVKETYKFFFAFENSLCEDYITEKVFKWFSEDIIVVVRGARYYNRYLPKGTYIDADDFTSPEELAKFLTQLSADEDEYIKYLKRKDEYIVISEAEHVQLAYCNLCYKLNNLDLFRKPAEPLAQWWNVGKCTRPTV